MWISKSVNLFWLLMLFELLSMIPYVVVIVPRTIVPRRDLVPRMDAYDCVAGCALVLECMWTKLHHQFFLWNLWNHFSLVWSFKGVGPRRIAVRTSCLGLSFWVLSTNWHGNMCITHHATSLINNIERECSWEKLALMPFLFSFLEFLKTHFDVFSI